MPKKLGPYNILEQIGRGGMCEVFMAEKGDGELSKRVVVKKLLPQYRDDTEFQRLFKREAALLINLHHPNLVQVYDYLKSGKDYIIAMEYVDGVSLADIDKRNLSGEILVCIVWQILAGLMVLHNHPEGEILHRDISPDNILIDKNGEVKLTDFGIARQKGGSTEKTAIIGKMKYASPELFTNRSMDQFSDLYSLGKVLWESISKDRIFPEDQGQHIEIINKESDVNKKELLALIFGWVRNDSSERKQNAEEAIKYLEAKLDLKLAGLKQKLAVIVEQTPGPVAKASVDNGTKILDSFQSGTKEVSHKKIWFVAFVLIVFSLLVFSYNFSYLSSQPYKSVPVDKSIVNKPAFSLLPVDSKRKAVIEIDGKDMGHTPQVLKLSPGKHSIKLTDSKDKSLNKSITLVPGANPEVYFRPEN